MVRVLIEELALFLVPFLLFAIVLVLQRRRVLLLESWSSSLYGLTIAGLLLVIGSFIVFGVFADRHTGAYVPPHMENGQVVPGHFK